MDFNSSVFMLVTFYILLAIVAYLLYVKTGKAVFKTGIRLVIVFLIWYLLFDRFVEGGKISRYLRVCLNRLSRLFR